MERGPFSQFPDALDPVLSLVPYHGRPRPRRRRAAVGLRSSTRTSSRRSRAPTRHAARPRGSSCPSATPSSCPTAPARSRSTGWTAGSSSRSATPPARASRWAGSLLGIVGLMGSLFIRPRRAWVRVPGRGAGTARRTVVEVAGLDRSSGGDLDDEIDELERRIRTGPAGTHPTREESREHCGLRGVHQQRDHVRLDRLRAGVRSRTCSSGLRGRVGRAEPPRGEAARRRGRRGGRGALPAATVRRTRRRSGGPTSRGSRPVGPHRRRADRRRRAAAPRRRSSRVASGSDPVRVPWGNMYEFTLAGAFGVGADLPRCSAAATGCAGWACRSPASRWSC